MTRTAVLVHGYDVLAPDWEHVAWGKPREEVYGRASRAIQYACMERVSMLYFGGGGSERSSMKESEYTYAYAAAHADEMPGLRPPYFTERTYLPAIMHPPNTYIDVMAKNTREEIVNCAQECTRRGINRMVLVSSPSHVSRCSRTAEELRAAGKLGVVREVLVTASDTCWMGATPAEVVIFEPPCLSRLHKYPLNKHMRPVLDIPRERIPDFTKELDVLVAKYI